MIQVKTRSTALAKTMLTCIFLTTATLVATAQQSTVPDALARHGIDAGILDPQQMQQPEDYAFDLTFTSTAAGKTTTVQASFNPSAPQEERWTVISVNGNTPSRSDINAFRRDHAKPKPSPARTDDASYKVEKETADYLVISYKQDPASLSKDVAFMKDCRSYLTINLKTKRAEQVQALNEKPVKIKIITADKFDLTVKYIWNEQAKHYFTQSENLNMQAKFLGQPANVETMSVYSNYRKP